VDTSAFINSFDLMKIKILLSLAVTSVATICSGAGGAAGTVVGPVGMPTSQTPQPTTSQTPGLTLPPSTVPIQPNVNANTPGNLNGNGNFNNHFARTNSLYSITNPPGKLNSQPFGNSPGGVTVMPVQPGINSQVPNLGVPARNPLPTANSPLPATVAPSPGANTSPNIMPPAGANSAPAPVTAQSPGLNNNNSTPPNQ
jgi:hypothetical protein